VSAADVLVYMGELEPFFAAARKALAPQGLLAFSVEAGEGDGYIQQLNGRYRHAPRYVQRLAAENGFTIHAHEETVLRYEMKQAVPGALFVLGKQSVQ
jgi:predicted TPR repeat methyltransferase